jgi:chromosome segregation protein
MAEEQPSYFHWRDEEKRLRGEIDENARLWQAIETRLTSQTAALKGCSDHQHACQQEQTHLKESLARLEAALQQKFLLQEQHRERLRREEQWSQGHQKRLQELADQQSRLVQELKDVEALLATKQSTAATQQALLEELESQYRREEHKTLQLQQGHQQLREWLQRLSGELKRSHERLSQLDKEEQAQKKRQEQYLEERERLKNRHEVLVRAHALRMQEVAEGKQKTALQEKDLQPLVAQLAEGSAQGESLHGSLMDAQAALGRLELAEARLEADLLHLREKFQGLHTTPRGEEVPPPLEESELEGAQARINQLKRQLSELGSVNLLAIEEFEEIDQRYQFLQHQHRDLVESIAEIRRTIQTLNRQSAKQFSETFLAVNALFGEVFQELFGGGTARMELVDPEQINESGIDLIIQPPGKKLQNALLMSGGEKALTAIALLFAIFAYRPSPFCLLDEVDAPLDESNVSRLAAKLKSLRQQTQFIIITHHKTTMNIAESLVGVTMEETGCSKIVSVQFSD